MKGLPSFTAALALPVVFAAIALGASVSASTTCTTCLGGFLGVTSPAPYFPHDSFVRLRARLEQYGLPEFLYIAIPQDDQSTVQAWPVVKTLDQFGTWKRVGAVERSCHEVTAPSRPSSPFCSLPTLDLSRAVYRSRYVRFVYGVAGTFSGTKFRANRSLPSTQAALFRRYACAPARFGCGDRRVRVSDFLEVIDRYEQTGSQFLDRSAFQLPVSSGSDATASTPTFDEVHSALATGKELANGSYIVTYINGETNIMTALVCRSDGSRPTSVCKRPVIQTIIRSVK